MVQAKSSDRNRWSLIASVLMIGLISLVQPGCNCGSSDAFTSATVASVFPPQNSDNALTSTIVAASFGIDMNATTINDSTFTLTEVGGVQQTATVSYEPLTRTATLDPATDLVSGTEYRATISSTVEDANGNTPLSSDFVWSFTVTPSMLLVSKNSFGVTANDTSKVADVDASGRYIVFESEGTNLQTVFTTLNRSHIYRKDTLSGEVALVSIDSTGLVEANNHCFNPRVSSNGRFVVFESRATNLDPVVASNGISQIYIKDMDDGSIEIASRSESLAADNSLNTAANARVSDDGRFVAFQSADNDLSPTIGQAGIIQIYLKDMSDESVAMISRTAANAAGNDSSSDPDMSPDSSHIVFESLATNLVSTTIFQHIYYVDTSVAHAVEQISETTSPGTGADDDSFNATVSDDGNLVVFETGATNLDILDNNGRTDIFIRDRTLLSTNLVSSNSGGTNSGNSASTNASISGNGDYVAFNSLASDISGGTLGVNDIFVRDLSVLPAIDIDRVNIPVSGSATTSDTDNPAISSDGRYVSFDSDERYTLDDTDSLLDVYRANNSTFQ